MSLDVNVTVKGEMENQSENKKKKKTPQKPKTKTPMIGIDKKGRILKSEIFGCHHFNVCRYLHFLTFLWSSPSLIKLITNRSTGKSMQVRLWLLYCAQKWMIFLRVVLTTEEYFWELYMNQTRLEKAFIIAFMHGNSEASSTKWNTEKRNNSRMLKSHSVSY